MFSEDFETLTHVEHKHLRLAIALDADAHRG